MSNEKQQYRHDYTAEKKRAGGFRQESEMAAHVTGGGGGRLREVIGASRWHTR